MCDAPTDVDRVLKAELTEIKKRREVAGFTETPKLRAHDGERAGTAHESAEFTVADGNGEERSEHAESGEKYFPVAGLALSGGGVRSASFNLGFLQAINRLGVLRHFDYLSTVSGGGYVGAFLTSMALNDKLPKLRRKDKRADVRYTRSKGDHCEQFATQSSGRQPPMVRRLIHGGMYLRKPAKALNRYVFGLFVINLFIGSLVSTLASSAAWLFRLVDERNRLLWISALGFQSDILRAIFPGTVFAIAWLLFWMVRSMLEGGLRRPSRRVRLLWSIQLATKSLFLAAVTFLVLGVIALLVTGDIAFGRVADKGAPPKDAIDRLTTAMMYVLTAIVLVAALPALRIGQLIQSGAAPRNPAESWLFRIVSTALLVGLPLLAFAFFAREDIAGSVSQRVRFNTRPVRARPSRLAGLVHDHRDPRLLSDQHVKSWTEFAQTLEQEARRAPMPPDSEDPTGLGGYFSPSLELWRAARTPIPRAGGTVTPTFVSSQDGSWFVAENEDPQAWDESIRLAHAYDELRRRYWTFQRWIDWRLVGRTYGIRKASDAARREVIDRVNHFCLSNPALHRAFDAFSVTTPQDEAFPPRVDVRKIVEFRERAKGLEAQYTELFENRSSDAQARGRVLDEVRSVNRQLVQAYFGGMLHDDQTVFAYNVYEEDQAARLVYACGFALLTLILGLFSLNFSSGHGFYREQLARMWLLDRRAVEHAERKTYLLKDLDTSSRGAPYLLINATVHLGPRPAIMSALIALLQGLIVRQTHKARPTWTIVSMHKAGQVGSADWENGAMARFLFSKRYCGSRRLCYIPTEQYEANDLASVMALSGSAVTPMMNQGPSLRFLLALANLRLGQWIPNPGRWPTFRRFRYVRGLILSPIGQFLQSMLLRPNDRLSLFVSDGGHYENLGLEALLERHTRVIVSVDAGHDPDGFFSDLLRVIRRSRAMKGYRIELLSESDAKYPMDGLGQMMGELAKVHCCLFKVTYPDEGPLRPAGTGYIIYVKPNFTGDEAVELIRYRRENPKFPYDPTIDQFYDQRRFESYRHLGEHIGERLCRDLLRPDMGDSDPEPDRPWLADWNPPAPGGLSRELAARAEVPDEVNDQNFRKVIGMLRHGSAESRKHAACALAEAAGRLSASNRQKAATALFSAALTEADRDVRDALIEMVAHFGEDASRYVEMLEWLSRGTWG